MPIISNTTPIVSLLKINKLNLLHEFFDEIIIPEAVYREITAKSDLAEEIRAFMDCDFIKVKSIKNEFAVALLQKQLGLDRGESEAIVLANDLNMNFLLIDEKRGRKVAEDTGLKIIGTLGVIVKAKKIGRISSVKTLLDELISQNIRISTRLYEEILCISGEDKLGE